MKEGTISIQYKSFSATGELPQQLQQLLLEAKAATANSYAPYSKFYVGAAALLNDGTIVTGSNQENASSPVGICAERVTLSAVSAFHPGKKINALAISVKSNNHIDVPVAPCGICRQTILEYEQRFHQNIQLILQGEAGMIYVIESAKDLLPLYFSRDDLKV